MAAPLRVLIVTDSFPPHCGGSGWSTWELTRGLTRLGHAVDVVHVRVGQAASRDDQAATERDVTARSYEGVPVTDFALHDPQVPFVRNVVKNELLWRRLERWLFTRLGERPADVLHAQHVMTTVPAIRAGLARGVPVVATVRDYWPVCYWSDLIYDPRQSTLCPACSVSMMTRCVAPRAGTLAPLTWPLIPYMRANLRTKRHTLARASAIVAVSSVIARDLVTRAPELPRDRLHTIPNPFDMAALDAVYERSSPPMAGAYLLYVGKLAVNKGVQYLVPAIARAGVRWPVVIVGDGPLRQAIEGDARQHGIDLRVLGWRGRDEVWGWMRHASLLAFPSYGPESLSRVLVEAAALGVPIAAMNTGGTTDILTHQQTALLSTDADGFARDLATLAADAPRRAALGQAARADVHARFEASSVAVRVEQVYRQVLRL